MRVNIYGDELTSETELVRRPVWDREGNVRHLYGLRIYLESPGVLNQLPGDDARSALTLWVRHDPTTGHDFAAMTELLRNLTGDLFAASTHETVNHG